MSEGGKILAFPGKPKAGADASPPAADATTTAAPTLAAAPSSDDARPDDARPRPDDPRSRSDDPRSRSDDPRSRSDDPRPRSDDPRPRPGAARPRPGAAVEWMRRIVAGLSIFWALILAVVFALRVGFPLELEWMEGGTLQQAWRVQQGLPVYGPPTADFVPFLYTPLYPALVAALGTVLPLDYPLARGISILAVVAICLALWRLVRFEHKPRSHAALAVGLFLSGYVFGFRWLDIGRGDALFLALLMWGLTLLRQSEVEGKLGWRRAVLAGLLVALAFWTKQTAAVFVLVSGLAGLIVAPRQVWAYAATIALVAGGGVLLGQWLTDGWLWTWIYETHQAHAFNVERFRRKTWGMFLHASPFIAALWIALAGAGSGVALRRARQLRRLVAEHRSVHGPLRSWAGACWIGLRGGRGPIYWGLLTVAGLLVSALGYATQFAEPNAFLPGICLGAAFLAVALPDAAAPAFLGLTGPRRALEFVGLLLIAAQLIFALLVEPLYQPIQDRGLRQGLADSYAWQDPSRTIPSAEQRAAASELRGTITSLPGEQGGELLALHRAWWPILAGGRGSVGAMGINDVDQATRRELQQSLRADLASGRFSAVWIDGSVPRWLQGSLRRWDVVLRLRGDQRVRPMSGWMSEAGMVTPWRGEQMLLIRRPARGR